MTTPAINAPDHECLNYGKHIWWTVAVRDNAKYQECNCGAKRKVPT